MALATSKLEDNVDNFEFAEFKPISSPRDTTEATSAATASAKATVAEPPSPENGIACATAAITPAIFAATPRAIAIPSAANFPA